MTSDFRRNLAAVTVVHVAVVCLVFIAAIAHGCRRVPPPAVRYLPVRIALARPESPPPTLARVAPRPPPQLQAGKSPQQTPTMKPKPKPVVRARRRDSPPAPPTLTREEVEKMLRLDQEAPSSPTARTVPDDQMYRALVRQAFYDAWMQPNYADVGDAVASASVRLDKNGTVRTAVLSDGSGNPILDASVEKALQAVKRIPGLSEAFVERYETLTILFNVEEQ